MIKLNDSGIQWTAEAKEAFCKDMETIMEIAVDKVEQTREKTNGKKRINVVNVRDAMFSLVTTLIRGEKNE
tara:strand:- start:2734 stop:2946 length:213 start_codon:yes stop_codon:yes gene_type:complete